MKSSYLLPLLLPLSTLTTLASAECNYQDVGTFAQKWRLSTYKSDNCIDQTSDVTHSGFGHWCVNVPNGVRSFIFSVGTGYTGVNLDSCTIFLYEGNTCGSDWGEGQLGRSRGEWKKSKLSKKARGMGSAAVQCTELFRRDGEEDGTEGEKGKKFMKGDDGVWYEESEDGKVVKARVIGDFEDDAVVAEKEVG